MSLEVHFPFYQSKLHKIANKQMKQTKMFPVLMLSVPSFGNLVCGWRLHSSVLTTGKQC